MTKRPQESRRYLRECAFQALCALEFGGDEITASRFAYSHDKTLEEAELAQLDLPIFLLDLVNGVRQHQVELDEKIASRLKAGWTLNRLTLIDKTIMRLGLYEVTQVPETPDRVAVNEAIELAKKYSDLSSRKLINGVLSYFVQEEK